MAPMARPAAVEPVKLTLSMPSWRTRCSPTSRPAGRMLTAPSGRPSWSTSSASMNPSSGVSGAGFSTIGHAAAIAMASLLIAR